MLDVTIDFNSKLNIFMSKLNLTPLATPMTPAIHTHLLGHRFGSLDAVRNLDL